MKLKHAFLIILLVLIIDQWSKIYIKTHFILNEAVTVFSWFQIYFVENEGAAWGGNRYRLLAGIGSEKATT